MLSFKEEFQELCTAREKQVEELEVLNTLMAKINFQTLEILDNQVQVVNDIQDLTKNEKDQFFDVTVDEDGFELDGGSSGIHLFKANLDLYFNSTVFFCFNMARDTIQIAWKRLQHKKQKGKLYGKMSQYDNQQQQIHTIFSNKEDIQGLRDQLHNEIEEITNKLIQMLKNHYH